MMRFIMWVVSLFLAKEDIVMDYVPVKKAGCNSKWREKALRKAQERHGKEFKTHTKVPRVEPLSRTLQELNELSKPPASTVSSLDSRRNAR